MIDSEVLHGPGSIVYAVCTMHVLIRAFSPHLIHLNRAISLASLSRALFRTLHTHGSGSNQVEKYDTVSVHCTTLVQFTHMLITLDSIFL